MLWNRDPPCLRPRGEVRVPVNRPFQEI